MTSSIRAASIRSARRSERRGTDGSRTSRPGNREGGGHGRPRPGFEESLDGAARGADRGKSGGGGIRTRERFRSTVGIESPLEC